MAQSLQSTPTVAANLGGTNHQVNLRDYLNMRVAPFLKKAITESLEASPEFPLQWLGENLIRQSMLFEGNPDSTNIKERFLYKFDMPVAAAEGHSIPTEPSTQAEPATATTEPSLEPISNTDDGQPSESVPTQDAQMADHVNGGLQPDQGPQNEESRDTEMEGTS